MVVVMVVGVVVHGAMALHSAAGDNALEGSLLLGKGERRRSGLRRGEDGVGERSPRLIYLKKAAE